MRGTVSRFGGGVVNPKSRVPVKMSVKRRNAALNRKDKAQMAGWALDAIWGLLLVGMIVVVAVVRTGRLRFGSRFIRAPIFGSLGFFATALRVIKVALLVTLAAPPRREQAGRLVVVLNGGSRRSGRRFWKVITTLSATAIRPYSRTTSVVLAATSAVASTPKRPQPPSWSA